MVRALFSFCKWATVTLGLFSSFLEMSEKRAEVLWRYISPYIKIPVLEKDFHFSGSDWNGLITMVRADVNVPGKR